MINLNRPPVIVATGVAIVAMGQFAPTHMAELDSKLALTFIAVLYTAVVIRTLLVLGFALFGSLDENDMVSVRQGKWILPALVGIVLMGLGWTTLAWGWIILALAIYGLRSWAQDN